MKCTVCYERWSDTDLEVGDTDERGTDREETFQNIVHLAHFLADLPWMTPSSSRFHPGIWYSSDMETHYPSGKVTMYTYHFSDIDKSIEWVIYEYLTGK